MSRRGLIGAMVLLLLYGSVGYAQDVEFTELANIFPERILSICELGGEVFVGEEDGELLKWDGAGSLVQVAPGRTGTARIRDLLVMNGEIYGNSTNGRLVKWNGTKAWAQVAPYITSGTENLQKVALNGQIFMGSCTGSFGTTGGRLLRWNGTSAWVVVAPRHGSIYRIESLEVHGGQIYGGSGNAAELLRWNGSDAWEQVAGQYGSETVIRDLLSHEGSLYGVTLGGLVLRWNGTDTWELVASCTGSGRLYCAAVLDGKIYVLESVGLTGGYTALHELAGSALVERARWSTEGAIGWRMLAMDHHLYVVTDRGRLLRWWNGQGLNADIQEPTIIDFSPSEGEVISNPGRNLVVHFSDTSGIKSVRLYDEGGKDVTALAAITADSIELDLSIFADGFYRFTFILEDYFGNITTKVFTFTVNFINYPPTAVADTYTMNVDEVLSVTSPGVLANDTDPDSSLTASLFQNVQHGTLVLNNNGSFTYTPTTGYFGPDSFQYTAADESNTSQATVSITVLDKQAPTILQSYPAEGEVITTPGSDLAVTFNDNAGIASVRLYDKAGNDVSSQAVITTNTIELDLASFADGSYRYTLVLEDIFGNTTTQPFTFTINYVNDPPTATNDVYTIDEDAFLTVATAGVLANDADIDSALAATLLRDAQHGNLVLNSNGSFSYMPGRDYFGSDTFQYAATDGLSASPATVTIMVAPVNDPPMAVSTNESTPEDTPKAIHLSAMDVDSPALTYVIVRNVSHGTLTGTPPDLTYTPNANFCETDSFTFEVNDGSLGSEEATVTVMVVPVNDAPVADPQSLDTPAGKSVALTLTGRDVENSALSFAAGTPAHGTLSGTAPHLVYTPNPGFAAQDSFTFVVHDGAANSEPATVTIEVIAPPAVLFSANPSTIGPGGQATLTWSTQRAETVSVSPGIGQTPASATRVVSPTATTTFELTATGKGGTSMASAVVTVDAHPPTITNSSFSEGEVILTTDRTFRVGFSDTSEIRSVRLYDKDGIDVSSEALITADSIELDLSTFADGFYRFTLMLEDYFGNITCRVFSFTIDFIDQPPIALADAYTMSMNDVLSVPSPGVLANDTDLDSTLIATLVQGVQHGTLVLNSNGSFTYTPGQDYFGPDGFQYTATDGRSGVTATVSITIARQNLITNYDMELDSNWTNYGTPSGNARSSEQRHGGDYSRKFSADSANEGIRSSAFATGAARHYTWSAWVNPPPRITSSSNEIRNGDMELASDWNDVGAPGANELSSEQAHGGTSSRKFVPNGPNQGISSAAFPTVGGRGYVWGAWVYPVPASTPDDTLWTLGAPSLNGQVIVSLASLNGQIYAGTAPGGRLFRWNGVNAWTEVAGPLNGQTWIDCLTVLNGEIYGGTYGPDGARLFKWNGFNAWIQAAGQPSLQADMRCLVVLNGQIYGATANNGYGYNGTLYRWNGSDAWIKVADQLNGQTSVLALCVLDGQIYAGTHPGGRLLKWNGSDAWVEVAPQLSGQYISSLTVLNGEIYGGTSPGGRLFKWNGINAWVEVAGQLNAQTSIYSLSGLDEQIYGGTNGGRLFRWNGSNAWVEVAPRLSGHGDLWSLIAHAGEIYTGSANAGGLLNWRPGVVHDAVVRTKIRSGDGSGFVVDRLFEGLAPNDWNFVSGTFIEGAGTGGADALIVFESDAQSKGTWYIDDVTLTHGIEDKGVVRAKIRSGDGSAWLFDHLFESLTPNAWNLLSGTFSEGATTGGEAAYIAFESDAVTDGAWYVDDVWLLDSMNDPPIAAADTYKAAKNTMLSVSSPGVLVNDRDADSTLTVELVQDVQHGTLVLNRNGSFIYTPGTNYLGPDTFQYVATDGLGSSQAIVTITVEEDTQGPTIISSYPGSGQTINGRSSSLLATFGDVSGIVSVKLYDDLGNDVTSLALITADTLELPLGGLAEGSHRFILNLQDTLGNTTSYEFPFTVDDTPPVTTASPPGGKYGSPISVALVCSEPSIIYYSVDGYPPFEGASNTFAAPYTSEGIVIPIARSTMLQFFALDRAGNREQTKSRLYLFGQTPAAVENVNVLYNALQARVEIGWTPAQGPVSGYRIYRCNSHFDRAVLDESRIGNYPAPARLKIGTDVPGGFAAATDATFLSGVTYWYAVTAVNASGAEAPASELASVYVPPSGPPPNRTEAIARGLAWLECTQAAEGYWGENARTRLLATSEILTAFRFAGKDSAGIRQGAFWLRSQHADNNDYLARKILALHELGQNVDEMVNRLISQCRNGGGCGIQKRYRPDPIDTALTALAVNYSKVNLCSYYNGLYLGLKYNLWKQRERSYGWVPNKDTSVYVSALVYRAIDAPVTDYQWILDSQDEGGSYGNGIIDSAAVLAWLEIAATARDAAAGYLLHEQAFNGSWNNDPYLTGLCLTALLRETGVDLPPLKCLQGDQQSGEVYLDGENYLYFESTQDLSLANGDFNISFEVKLEHDGRLYHPFFSHGQWGWKLVYDDHYHIIMFNTPSFYFMSESLNLDLFDSSYHQVRLTRSGSDFGIWVDGNRKAWYTNDSPVFDNTSSGLYLGRSFMDNSEWHQAKGYIRNFQIMTSGEVIFP